MITPSISIDRQLKKVTIEMALEAAHPSKGTGKTMVIASTRGLRTSTERFAHRPISYTANVFFYPANPANSGQPRGGSARSDKSQRLIGRKHPQSEELTAIQKGKTS